LLRSVAILVGELCMASQDLHVDVAEFAAVEVGNRAVSGRSLALRPRLAAGLP
jgi:hypothetical protein